MIAGMMVEQNSLVITGEVNGHNVDFVIDTGDALGPTLNSEDAQAANVTLGEPIGIEGAGGASTVYQAQATIEVGEESYEDETVYVDTALTGHSLIGLPFFLKKNPAGIVLAFTEGWFIGL